MNEVNLPQESSLGVQKSEPTITMWKDSVPVEVPVSEQGRFQGWGFTVARPEQLGELADELEILTAELVKSAKRFVEGIQADGVIDSSDQAEYFAMRTAFKTLDDKLTAILSVAHATYPVKQGASVTMVDNVQLEHEVDPGQVSFYENQGWSIKE